MNRPSSEGTVVNNNNHDRLKMPNIVLLCGSGFNHYLLVELLKQLGIIYTETFTIQSLLQALQDPNSFDAVMFDGNLVSNEGLTSHVRGVHPTIPLVCLTDDIITAPNEYSHIYGKNEVIINPPTSKCFCCG